MTVAILCAVFVAALGVALFIASECSGIQIVFEPGANRPEWR